MNLSKASLQLALGVLVPFQENSSYVDYQDYDGWTDEAYEAMIAELQRGLEDAASLEIIQAEAGAFYSLLDAFDIAGAQAKLQEVREKVAVHPELSRWETEIGNAKALLESQSHISVTDQTFFYREEHSIPHIDPLVAALCAAINETILVKVCWEHDSWGKGSQWMRVEANIYGLDREELIEKFGQEAAEAHDAYRNGKCDEDMIYDGDHNWAALGEDMVNADEILAAYIAEQQKRYPDCMIQDA